MRVLARDNFTCRECGAKDNILAHHIKSQHFYPQIKLEIDNGKTLCHDCHKKILAQLGLFYWVGRHFSKDGWFYRKISRKNKHQPHREILSSSAKPEDKILTGYQRLYKAITISEQPAKG